MGTEVSRRRQAFVHVGLLMILATASAGGGQEPSISVAKELEALAAAPRGESAAGQCGGLLQAIDGESSLSALDRAKALEKLRQICSGKLPWSDPLLARIADRSLVRHRIIADEEPAAFCLALQELGYLEHVHGRLRQAYGLYHEALAVAQNYNGKGMTNEDLARALDSMSSLLLDAPNLERDPNAAWHYADRSVRLRRQATPFRAEKLVSALTTRARVEEAWLVEPPKKSAKSALATARDTLYEAERISRGLGPEFRVEMGRLHNNLGSVLYRLGELPEAIEFLEKAERLRQDDGTGKPSRQLASTQQTLGQVYFDLGDYPRSIAYHRQAVENHGLWVGKTDPSRYGESLVGLATVLEEAGRWEEALEIQNQALKLRQDAADRAAASQPGSDGEAQMLLARSLTRLGALQQRMGMDSAERSLTRALAIEERVLGARSNATRAETLYELAKLWWENGEREQFRDAISRCLKELGEIGEGGILLLEATALSALSSNEPRAGLETLARASQYAAEVFGPDHPYQAGLLQRRAELRSLLDDWSGAVGDALLAQRLSLPQVKAVLQAFPRDQALVFAADRRRSLDLAFQLTELYPQAASSYAEEVWQAASSSRMLVRDAEIDRQRLLRSATDRQLAGAAQRLTSARERYAYLLVQTQGTSETHSTRLREARRQLAEAEEVVASKTRPLLRSTVAEPSIRALRKELPDGAAMVSFFQYRRQTGSNAYFAFVLGSSRVQAVYLGETITLDWLVQQWREAVLTPGASVEDRRRAGEALRRKIWDPIAPQLDRPGNVFVVPDGSLYQIPFAALPAPDSGYLIEKGWAFHTLTAERDLVRRPVQPGLGPWLALGAVDYEQASLGTEVSENLLRGDPESSPSAWRGCPGGLPSFLNLPASAAEIQDLKALWHRLQPAATADLALATLTGRDATERALRKTVAGQRVIHLATHGFILSCRLEPPRPAIRGIGGLSLSSSMDATELPAFSGLVLAGANTRETANRSDEDGILTEDEILDLDLDSVDWVVLSACNSGLGTFRPGEGLIGMLRAFQVAGAKTVIASLWSVRDRAARAWMRELYRARFERRVSTLEAVRQASLRRLEFLRKKGIDNPADWAGFVSSGQWQ